MGLNVYNQQVLKYLKRKSEPGKEYGQHFDDTDCFMNMYYAFT
jgi:hypothetical protein